MARSFSNAKFISTFLANRLSVIASRRGYASAASQGAESSSVGRSNAMLKRGVEESKEKSSWVLDPDTGYYRPEGIKQINAAELRRILLEIKN